MGNIIDIEGVDEDVNVNIVMGIIQRIKSGDITSSDACDEILELIRKNADTLGKRINNANGMDDEYERLEEYRSIAEDLANQYTYDMGLLEDAISDALDVISDEVLDETDIHCIEDITQNISVTSSNEW